LLELAILGLLKEKPMHGYELKKRLSYMLGHFWTVSYGSLYPALKRLEKMGSIEKAYSIKDKARTRNVYRITKSGETLFMKLLRETAGDSTLSDPEKFDTRMAFFQYLEPEVRLNILEKRKSYLEKQVESLKKYRVSNREEDHYRKGLMRHKVDQVKSEIRWIERLILHERETINSRQKSVSKKAEMNSEEGKASAAWGA